MAIGSGLGSQFGVAAESVVGTIVSPTRFYEYNSESLSLEKEIEQGAGLRGSGLYARSTRRAYTTKSAGGDVELDVATKGMGLLFKHMLGAAATPTIISGTAYRHIYTPGSLVGQSLTLQKGVPQTDGTVKPFTYNGCKVLGWELSCGVGEILTLSLTFDAWNETTATGLATASYPTSTEVFHFAQGSVTLGGTVSTTTGLASVAGGTVAASVTGATVSGSNAMKTDRYFFGSSGVKAEQIENDWREVGGSLDLEFVNQATVYDLFAADTATALKLSFVGTTAISGANFPTVEVLIPSIRFDGESPQVGGPDVVEMSGDFTGLDDGTNAAVQIVYITADATV